MIGNGWGLPWSWHPDSLVAGSLALVDQRTIDVKHYQYGALPYYTIAAVVAAPVYAVERIALGRRPDPRDERAIERFIQARTAWVLWGSRLLSALLATATVAITIRIGQRLFDLGTGLLAGLLATVSMALVAIAHFCTTDSHAVFWYWLACLAALRFWQGGGWSRWAIAGVLAGVAAGVKLDRTVVVAPLVVALLVQARATGASWPRRAAAKAAALPALMLAGCALANPVLLLAPFTYLDGVTRELFYNVLRDAPSAMPYQALLESLVVGLGWPLLALSLGGAVWMGFRVWAGPDREPTAWLLSTWLVYAVALGSGFVRIWYVPLLVPGLMLGAARMLRQQAARRPVATWGVTAVAVAFSLVYCALMDVQFVRNSRARAAEWVLGHVPAGAAIGTDREGLQLPDGRYVVREIPGDAAFWQPMVRWKQRLDGSATYARVRSAILGAERWAVGHLGLPARPEPYRAWFDYVVAQRARRPDIETRSLDADALVLLSPYHPRLIQQLDREGSGYRRQAEFGRMMEEDISRWRWWLGLAPRFPFVDTRVAVYEKVRSVARGQPDRLTPGAPDHRPPAR